MTPIGSEPLFASTARLGEYPTKRNRTEAVCFSPYLYRAHNSVERFFNKIKHCRRVATRYDKLAANYLAFVHLALIRLWLRANEFTSSLDVVRHVGTVFLAHDAFGFAWCASGIIYIRMRHGRPQGCRMSAGARVPEKIRGSSGPM